MLALPLQHEDARVDGVRLHDDLANTRDIE